MSAVRYFDNIPHIVRYGMHSEKDEKCWIKFWRNGVRFTIKACKDDVNGTSFYLHWKPLLQERSRGDQSLSEWVEQQWQPLCDLLIATSMPTLRQLAPEQEYWVTLRDYLHTPSYKLNLIRSKDMASIESAIEDGPTDTGAYNLEPVSKSTVSLPQNLQHYLSSHMTVIGKDKDWRQGPAKVSSLDGKQFYFRGCEMGTRSHPSEQMTNSSLDAIRANLKIYDPQSPSKPSEKWPESLPRVHGVVLDDPPVEEVSGTIQKENELGHRTNGEQRIAGILLTWIPHGKTLKQTVQDSTASQAPELIEKSASWKAHIEEALIYLHERAVFLGGREGWPYINEYSIMIGDSGKVWLTASHVSSAGDVEAEEANMGMTKDFQACNNVFDQWLPNEVAKKHFR